MKRLLTIALSFAFLNLTTSCKNDSSKKSDSSDDLDMSSPKATVQTFFYAAKNKDEDALSKCFSEDAPGEFRAIINKKMKAKDLDELSEEADKAEVLSQEKHGNKADVKVRYNNRDEEIHLVKEDGDWLILDF